MIDRVNNNPYTNAYNNTKIKKTVSDDTPKFLLGDEEGVVWDRQDKSEKEDGKTVNKTASVKEDRAELESVKQLDITNREVTSDADNKSSFSVKNIFDGIKSFISRILKAVWYEDDKENQEDNEEALTNKDVAATKYDIPDEKEKDKLIRDSISKKDNAEVMRLITDNYSKIPAKNSTLLTRYDKHGNIQDVNGADKVRILTDKNGMKM